jgi:hypothetical protein
MISFVFAPAVPADRGISLYLRVWVAGLIYAPAHSGRKRYPTTRSRWTLGWVPPARPKKYGRGLLLRLG